MIIDKGTISINPGIEFVTGWKDEQGNFKCDELVSSGRIIVNKMVTGCGFTTYCLINRFDTILISPRIRLIQNKIDQFEKGSLFYFNREIDLNSPKKNIYFSIDDLKLQFQEYLTRQHNLGKPLKILVTYDSFNKLTEFLENDFGISVAGMSLVIDESHSIIKDVKLKEYNNKSILSKFVTSLFRYPNLLFISATPIINYIGEVPEFRDNDVFYCELHWDNLKPLIQNQFKCRSSLDAFNQIYENYIDRGYFDVKYTETGQSFYSYEAVIFLNSVSDVAKIIKKYTEISSGKVKNPINLSDITIICSKTPENQKRLKNVSKYIRIADRIPTEGEHHTTWTFVTRTAFEGVDFYGPTASTFVVANYNVDCLSIDIASDIPQIIGRQRRKDNPFRDTINIFYTNGVLDIDDQAFLENQKIKMERSNIQIQLWTEARSAATKEAAVMTLTDSIDSNPNKYYLTTVKGYPEINPLIKISEKYCRDVLKNQFTWFIITNASTINGVKYDSEILQLRNNILGVTGLHLTRDKLKIIVEFLDVHPDLLGKVLDMLRYEGQNELGYYLTTLSRDRITASGYDISRMKAEIFHVYGKSDIKEEAEKIFKKGEVYSKKETKQILQGIYDKMGIKKTAKATELFEYLDCEITKKDGIKAIRVK